MHYAHPTTTLPVSEYERLQRLMLTMIGSRSSLAEVLRRKLGAATAVTTDDGDRDIALSGTRVLFRIDGEWAADQILSWTSPRRTDAAHLWLLLPRGLALLGLRAGQSISYRTQDHRTEFLEIEQVLPGCPVAAAGSKRTFPDVAVVAATSSGLTSDVGGGYHASR